jgi:hypothetical protein
VIHVENAQLASAKASIIEQCDDHLIPLLKVGSDGVR